MFPGLTTAAERRPGVKETERAVPAWVGYGMTVVTLAALTLLLLLLRPIFPLPEFPILYVLATMLVAYFFGVGPAVLAFLLGLFLFDFFFISPLYTVIPHAETPVGLAAIVAYLIGSFIVGFATLLVRRAKRRTERVAHELWESKHDLDRAQSVAHTGSWRLDIRRNELLWSDEVYRIFGIPLGTPMTYELFLASIHPEDREYVDREWQAALRGAPYDIEHRIIAGGQTKWVRERAELEFDERGALIGGFGTVQDVTQRKEAEEAIRASEANYRAIFEAANDAIFVHDAETGAILDVNPKMTEMYGYTAEEARHVSVADLSAEEQPYTQERALVCIRKAAEGAPQLFEWKARDKWGRVFWVEVNLKRTTFGGEKRLLAVVRDITDRKRGEEERQEEQRHRQEFYQRTILAATEGKLVVTDRDEICKIAGEEIAMWAVQGPADISVVRHGVQELAESWGIRQPRLGELSVAVGEAVTNAIKHAKAGTASVHRTDSLVLVVISDEGPGIPAMALPDVALRHGYSTAGTLGMGYKVMIRFADRVYLATGPEGTTVGVEMRIQPEGNG